MCEIRTVPEKKQGLAMSRVTIATPVQSHTSLPRLSLTPAQRLRRAALGPRFLFQKLLEYSAGELFQNNEDHRKVLLE